MAEDHNNEYRLERIVNMLIEYSRGNFGVREEMTDEDDALNTVISGLNMLGEELQHYQDELNQQNELLTNILSNIDEVVYSRQIISETPTLSPFTFISPRIEEILGFKPEELIEDPQKWVTAIHPDDNINTMKAIGKLLNGKEVNLSYRLFHPYRKEYIWIEDRIVPMKNAEGDVTHIYGTARDVSEQNIINIDLEEKNEFISRLISSSDQFFYIVAIDQEKTFESHFTYLSWQIEKIQGGRIIDINQNPMGWWETVHPEDQQTVMEANRIMFSTKQPITRIYRVKHATEDRYIWLEDYVVPVPDEHGMIREFYGSARDITSRKNAELEREQLIIELNKRYNELMQFNYIVSHNLRAPVANLMGLTNLLDISSTKEEQQTTIGYIKEATASMDEVLQDLNIILSTRSTLSEYEETFSLKDVVTLVCSNLSKEMKETNAIIHTRIEEQADELKSIKSFIQSSVFNLIANAIKYREKNRSLVINVYAGVKSGRTVISVSDNGMGIDLSKNRDRIFGMYSQLHTQYEGKGLGLYMTKTQIEALGGTIDVTSDLGLGTTFTITL